MLFTRDVFARAGLLKLDGIDRVFTDNATFMIQEIILFLVVCR